MRTALADAKIKWKIMAAYDDLRHATEDHGADSKEAVDCRELVRSAVRHGFAVGLTDEDILRITRPTSDREADKDIAEAITEQKVLEGPVLTAVQVKPKRPRRPRAKAISNGNGKAEIEQ